MGSVQMDAIHNYILHAIAHPGHVNPFYQSYMPFMNYHAMYPPASYTQLYNHQMMQATPLVDPRHQLADVPSMEIEPNEDSEQTIDAEDELFDDKDIFEEGNDQENN